MNLIQDANGSHVMPCVYVTVWVGPDLHFRQALRKFLETISSKSVANFRHISGKYALYTIHKRPREIAPMRRELCTLGIFVLEPDRTYPRPQGGNAAPRATPPQHGTAGESPVYVPFTTADPLHPSNANPPRRFEGPHTRAHHAGVMVWYVLWHTLACSGAPVPV